MSIETVILPLIAGFFGLSLGSFLNVVIYRVPRKESIVFPASHCPSCGSPIRYRDNIPVVSFLLLRGRCRACSKAISWRYPLVELFTACMAAVLFGMHGFSLQFIADTVLGSILLSTALIDLDYMIIPDRITFPGMVTGLLLSFRYGWGGYTGMVLMNRLGRFPGGLVTAVLGGVTGFLILYFMYLLGRVLFRRESMGMGDIKLALVIGFFVGPFWMIMTLALAVVFGSVLGVFQIAWRRKLFLQTPFGPFISAGGLCVLFFKPQIIFLVEQYFEML